MPPDNATTPCPPSGAARRRPGRARQNLNWSLTAAAVACGLLAAHALRGADWGQLVMLATLAWVSRVAGE
jgi:hypothetical protein